MIISSHYYHHPHHNHHRHHINIIIYNRAGGVWMRDGGPAPYERGARRRGGRSLLGRDRRHGTRDASKDDDCYYQIKCGVWMGLRLVVRCGATLHDYHCQKHHNYYINIIIHNRARGVWMAGSWRGPANYERGARRRGGRSTR